MAVTENADGVLILPVVQDVLHDDGVRAFGRPLEEASRPYPCSSLDAVLARERGRGGHDVRQVEEYPLRDRVRLQDRREQMAATAADIGQHPDAGKSRSLSQRPRTRR